MIRCPTCGSALSPDTAVCPYCGAALTPAAAAPDYGTPAEASAQTPAEGAYTQAPAEGSYTQAPAEGAYTQAPTEGSYTQAPAEGAYTQAPDAPADGVQHIPDAYTAGAPVKTSTSKDIAGGIGLRILRIAAGFIVIALLALGYNLLHQHSSFLTKGETVDMDAILETDGTYPVGEFVRAELPFVLDQFASEESRTNGIVSKNDVYYYVVLKNRGAIAVKAGSKDVIAILDQACDDTYAYLNDELEYFDDIHIEGKLKKLTGSELKGYFDDATEIYGFNDADSTVTPQYYVIDTTEPRIEKVLLYIVLPAAVILLVVVLIAVISKKKKKKAAAAPAPAQPYQQPPVSY